MGRMPASEDQQSIVCLIQQVNLYKELLSQVTYQNKLLTRDISFKHQNPMSQFAGMQNLNYLNAMGGLNLNGLGNLAALGNLGPMGGMGGAGMPNMGGMNPLSGVPQGMLGNNQFISPDMLNGQMNLMSNMMLNQQSNRPIDPAQTQKDKDSLPFNSNPAPPLSQTTAPPSSSNPVVPAALGVNPPNQGLGAGGLAGLGNGAK